MTRLTAITRRLLPILVVALLGLGVAPRSWAEDGNGSSTDELGEGTGIKADYDEVLGQEAKLEAAVDAAAQRRKEILVDIAGVQRELDTTRAQLARATLVLQAKLQLREAARRQLRAAQRRLDAATEELHAQAISSYVAGGTDHEMLSVLIGTSDDVSATGRTLSYADAVVDHQQEVIDAFTSARRARDAVAGKAEDAARGANAARDQLRGVESEQVATQKRLLDLADKEETAAHFQELALQQLRARKVEIEARVVSLEKDSDGIGIFLAARQQDQPAYVPGTITFRAPLEEFSLGSGFGMRMHPILHYKRLHAGADLSAPSGTPILAAASGTVLIAEVRGGYGNCVVIGHGRGIATVYAHQSKLLVQAGDKVKRGDVIGAVGSTGLSTGPHLHFETRSKGTPVDPTNFIDLEAASEASRAGG